jgi:hypothetical protein
MEVGLQEARWLGKIRYECGSNLVVVALLK